jgi:two-component system, chemotaxis family, chemotaxis protein CheY
LNILIVEDDFANRMLLQEILEPYGHCDIAVDGLEAIQAFLRALEKSRPYQLMCLDLNMPAVDGQTALKKIREIEAERGIENKDSVKVLIISGLHDRKNILGAFRAGCEAYIVKPYDEEKIVEELKNLELIPR